jgi:hypothetical protein
VAHPEAGVVGHRHLPAPEDLLEVARARAELRIDDDVGSDVEPGDVCVQVRAGGVERDRLDRDRRPLVLRCRPSHDEQVDRFEQLAAAERGRGAARYQLGLVGVVV